MDTKETTQGVIKEIEVFKVEKASTLAKKENINTDTTLLLNAISRTRSCISCLNQGQENNCAARG